MKLIGGQRHSQFLSKASDFGLGIGQLHREVLSTLGPPHAGRVTRRLGGDGSQGRELHTVSLLGELHDRLNAGMTERKSGQVKLCYTPIQERKETQQT